MLRYRLAITQQPDWSCWASADCDKTPLNEIKEHMAWLRANPFYAA